MGSDVSKADTLCVVVEIGAWTGHVSDWTFVPHKSITLTLPVAATVDTFFTLLEAEVASLGESFSVFIIRPTWWGNGPRAPPTIARDVTDGHGHIGSLGIVDGCAIQIEYSAMAVISIAAKKKARY